MVLAEIETLLRMLRAHGVKQFSGNGVTVEFTVDAPKPQLPPAVVALPDPITAAADSRPEMVPEVRAAMARLDPAYAEAFEFLTAGK